jgi:phosphoglycolate phosphatase
MLYLFDIDGTLLDTGGAGMAAIHETAHEVFGNEGPALDLAGSTDLGIVSKIFAHFQTEPTPAQLSNFFEVYLGHLVRNLTNGVFPGKVYPGVGPFIAELTARPDATFGLLTGNTAAGAAAKVQHFGLAHHFAFGAYGDDDADRNKLGPIALARAAQHTGKNFTAAETWIIGDTPKDIACAHAFGARCLAVATGSFTVSQLTEHRADLVVENLDQVCGRI